MNYVDIQAGYCRKRRSLRLELDREYIVKPLNEFKLKHRDRHCKLLSLEPSICGGKPGGYWVRFLDNNRRGKVEADDLIPVDGNYEEWALKG